MLVKHLRKEFYELLYGKRVLIIANLDVDSVCTTKILTELLKTDGIAFSLCPIDGVTGMKQAYTDYEETVHVVIMINCGLTVDIRAFFDNPRNKLFFILDCHRPVHVANFYDETKQVRILSLDDNFQEVPQFDDIFRPDDEEEEEEDEDEEEGEHEEEVEEDEEEPEVSSGSDEDDEEAAERRRRRASRKRKRKRGNRLDRRRERAQWVQNRNEIIFNYSQFSYFTLPSSLVALELSWAVARGDMQYVWWTCVALTDAFMLEKLARAEYIKKALDLSHHIAKEAHSGDTPKDALKVTFEEELCFYLYRHWNLYESVKMTPYSSCILKTWSLRGESKFHEMLGEMGFPLNEVRQKYASMDIRCRKKVKDGFKQRIVTEKYRLEDVFISSFVAEVGYRPQMSAFDCQLACLALLESPDKNKTVMDNFLASMSCLSKKQFDVLDNGIEMAKTHLTATFTQVQDYINMNAVVPRGGFLFALMPEGAPNSCYFKYPTFITILAQYTHRAVVAQARSKRWSTLPFVMMIPHLEGYWAVIGIKPLSFELPKNLFGKLFETLADQMRDVVLMEFLDPHIVLVKSDEKEKFLQLLDACMV